MAAFRTEHLNMLLMHSLNSLLLFILPDDYKIGWKRSLLDAKYETKCKTANIQIFSVWQMKEFKVRCQKSRSNWMCRQYLVLGTCHQHNDSLMFSVCEKLSIFSKPNFILTNENQEVFQLNWPHGTWNFFIRFNNTIFCLVLVFQFCDLWCSALFFSFGFHTRML